MLITSLLLLVLPVSLQSSENIYTDAIVKKIDLRQKPGNWILEMQREVAYQYYGDQDAKAEYQKIVDSLAGKEATANSTDKPASLVSAENKVKKAQEKYDMIVEERNNQKEQDQNFAHCFWGVLGYFYVDYHAGFGRRTRKWYFFGNGQFRHQQLFYLASTHHHSLQRISARSLV